MYAAILGQQELLKGDFNWAATGHFFSEGAGGAVNTQATILKRVWMGGYKCQLSVKILPICRLSVKF